MIDKPRTPMTDGKAAREARLAEQLRANLARRKAQARGRAGAAAAGADEAKRDSDTNEQES